MLKLDTQRDWKCYLEKWLGETFIAHSNKAILTKQLCRFSTSKPDMVFYKKDQFIVEESLVGGVCPMEVDGPSELPSPTTDETSNTFLGGLGRTS